MFQSLKVNFFIVVRVIFLTMKDFMTIEVLFQSRMNTWRDFNKEMF